MIDKQTYEIDYIRELQKKYVSDPGLIEHSLYAFGLLEALSLVKMPCGTSPTGLYILYQDADGRSINVAWIHHVHTYAHHDLHDHDKQAHLWINYLEWYIHLP